jgi:hypothetical protein
MSVKIELLELFYYCRHKIWQQFGDVKIQLYVQKTVKVQIFSAYFEVSVNFCYRVEYLKAPPVKIILISIQNKQSFWTLWANKEINVSLNLFFKYSLQYS